MNSRVFLDSRTVNTDCCAKEAKDNQNDEIVGYELYQYLPVECDGVSARFPQFSYDHVNLTGRVGYGLAEGCVVDNYSALRNDPAQLTRDRCRNQLFTRIFQGCPNLLHGVGNPDQELNILGGSVSSDMIGHSGCKRAITELETYHPIPMLDCIKPVQNPKHIVEPWVRGGDPTRDYVRRQEFLQQCGSETFQRRGARLH
jgi:hypothetical protein